MIGTLGWQELLILLVLVSPLTAAVLAVILSVSGHGSRLIEGGVIESWYGSDELVTASLARRLGANILDSLTLALTLWIGWFIWFAVVAPRGQTPGKQLLGLYVMRDDGTRAGGGYIWLREFVVKGLLFGLLSLFTFYLVWIVGAAWCLWDKNRQCLWDKIASTYVGYAPSGVRPLTANERLVTRRSPPEPVTADPAAASGDVPEQLRDLKRLLDEGIVTEYEYEERRRRLVEQL